MEKCFIGLECNVDCYKQSLKRRQHFQMMKNMSYYEELVYLNN